MNFDLQSSDISKLIEALAKAQGDIDVAVYDSNNPHFKSRYASYEAIRKACVKPLSSNGLAVTHSLMMIDGKRIMITQLSHVSGQWMRSALYLPQEKETPQGIGSSITYAKRYSLGALLAISSDEDDDGEACEKPHREDKPKPFSNFEPREKPKTNGEYVLTWGAHKGKSISDIPDDYIDYLKREGHLDKPAACEFVEALKKAGRL